MKIRAIKMLLRGFYKVVASAALLLGSGSESQAEYRFIQTLSTGVYQSTDGLAKVIVGSKDGALGLFIAHFKSGIDAQEFNAEKLPQEGSSHMFIRFDPAAEFPYSEAVLGERSYRIVGNLNVFMGENNAMSVHIDNSNPYITVSIKGAKGKEEALVGFYGLSEVVTGSGNLAAILAANQQSPEIERVVKPYTLAEGQLKLNDKEVQTPTVGIFVKHEHECLKDTTATLTLAQLKKIQAQKGEPAQAKLLESFLAENKKSSPTRGHLVLRADTKSPMIMLNIATKNVLDYRAIANRFSTRQICVLSPIG
jgi:hypothetical protein